MLFMRASDHQYCTVTVDRRDLTFYTWSAIVRIQFHLSRIRQAITYEQCSLKYIKTNMIIINFNIINNKRLGRFLQVVI